MEQVRQPPWTCHHQSGAGGAGVLQWSRRDFVVMSLVPPPLACLAGGGGGGPVLPGRDAVCREPRGRTGSALPAQGRAHAPTLTTQGHGLLTRGGPLSARLLRSAASNAGRHMQNQASDQIGQVPLAPRIAHLLYVMALLCAPRRAGLRTPHRPVPPSVPPQHDALQVHLHHRHLQLRPAVALVGRWAMDPATAGARPKAPQSTGRAPLSTRVVRSATRAERAWEGARGAVQTYYMTHDIEHIYHGCTPSRLYLPAPQQLGVVRVGHAAAVERHAAATRPPDHTQPQQNQTGLSAEALQH